MNRSQLVQQIREKGSYLCVGLDPDPTKLPDHLKTDPNPVFRFCKEIIEHTAPFCVAFKPNLAFFEAMGPEGLHFFQQVVSAIPSTHLVIADAKRGDIGNTAEQYAKAFFEQYKVDAITLSPYMGLDSIKPFVQEPGKWAIVLALTSNPGSADFQKLELQNGKKLFEEVTSRLAAAFQDDQLMFVAGATHKDELKKLRAIAPSHFFLVPGVGAQGGSLEEVSHALMNKDVGILVNASRSIIYASSGLDFAEAAAKEAQKMQVEMRAMLAKA